ncbi:S-adenosyl-L-methionine-dependent methyltransferase [Mucor mucedo]|uniref:S-adenosyl-L-methionine-dependent methyltransferase n=1 Tax=Mucor mucedo TaxID=29922 RepID=UPI00221E490B|nr:S-adenosyl-L-methionine-dependent methyltransferase [Mucor mucedo]KAI7882100.1 S-adenosyl-L-methionine-dependent methyltransferase [Mucor mucedo]
MANIEKIKFEQNQPLLTYIEQLLEDKFSISSSDRVLKVIEIGCGSGDFTLILKDKFKDKVQVTAIDPSETDLAAAKEKNVDASVDFQQSDIFKFSSTTRYDLVLFTKSLHHCIPVDQAVKNAYNLLSDDGIFLAEEIYLDRMQTKDTRWFFDRLDLLLKTECMTSLEEAAAKNQPSYKPMVAKLLNSSLPIEERWFRPHHHHHHGEHHHGEHKHSEHKHAEHKHAEHKHEQHNHEEGHTHQHHPHQEHKEHGEHEKKDYLSEIVGSSAVIDAITAQFGQQNITLTKVPYFYQFLAFCG